MIQLQCTSTRTFRQAPPADDVTKPATRDGVWARHPTDWGSTYCSLDANARGPERLGERLASLIVTTTFQPANRNKPTSELNHGRPISQGVRRIMTRAVLNRLHHPRQISQAIDAFIEVYHPEAAPLEWRKRVAQGIGAPSAPQTTLRISACGNPLYALKSLPHVVTFRSSTFP